MEELIYIFLFVAYVAYQIFSAFGEKPRKQTPPPNSEGQPNQPTLEDIFKEIMEQQQNPTPVSEPVPPPPIVKSSKSKKREYKPIKQRPEDDYVFSYDDQFESPKKKVKKQVLNIPQKAKSAYKQSKKKRKKSKYKFNAKDAIIGSIILERKY